MRTATRATTAGVVGLVALALTGCGTQHAGSAGEPPVLRIGTGDATAALAGGGTPTLAVALPEGPATAPVRQFTGEVTAAEVSALAAALGLTGSPEQHAYGWSVGRPGGAELAVRTDGTGPWTYLDGRERCGYLVDLDAPEGADVPSSCAPASDAHEPAPGAQRARAAAAAVLAAVGLGGVVADGARIDEYGPTTAVSLDPTVAGLPTSGIGTYVVVASTGVTSASGHLRATTEGAAYPLVGARAAWQRLGELPVPDIAIACPAPGPESVPPCSTTPPPITRVELGLALRTDPDGALLVPAWLFTSRAGTSAVVAVTPAFLAADEGAPQDGTGGGSRSGSGGGSDQLPAPEVPSEVPPASGAAPGSPAEG